MKRIRLPLLSFRNRLLISIALLLIIIIVVATQSLLYINSVTGNLREIAYVSTIDTGYITQLRTLIFEISNSVHGYFINTDAETQDAIALTNLQIEGTLDDILASSIAVEHRDSVLSIREQWRQLHEMAGVILNITDTAAPLSRQQLEQFDVDIEALFTDIGQLHLQLIQKISDQQQRVNVEAERNLFSTYIFFGVGIGLAVIVVFFLLRAFFKPINLLRQGASNFSKGNLSFRIPEVPRDELGELIRTFNAMANTLEKDQAVLKELATHDGITGLYNYRDFERQIQAEIERAQRYKHPFSLLMIDIDNFKDLNDKYGHQTGDHVLHSLAAQMCQEIRAVDHVSRYGGDEFAIILPEMPVSDALTVAERLRKNVANNPIIITEWQSVNINISVSIGVATFPEDAGSKDKLIAVADKAMYAAKNAGRNKVFRAK